MKIFIFFKVADWSSYKSFNFVKSTTNTSEIIVSCGTRVSVDILLAASVKHSIAEIFRKLPGIETEADATIKETESSCLWFEIYGIYRFITSLEWQISLIHSESRQLEVRRELNEAKDLLTQALISAESIYEKVMFNKRRASAIQDGL